MSTLKVEEKIILAAPVAMVWKFLLDPAAVAGCLPGARLDSVESDRDFTGTMKVKVGPVTTEFRGKATFAEVVPEEHRVRLLASGDDKGGSGSAKMVMSSRIVPSESGGSELHVTADVEMAGKLVRFGRGMMEGIGKQMFKQFAERVQKHLVEMEVAAAVGPGHDRPATPGPARAMSAEGARATELPAAVTAGDAARPASSAMGNEGARVTSDAPSAVPVGAESADRAVAAPPVAVLAKGDQQEDVLDAGGLMWRALWAWFVGLFRRLFGE